MSHLTGNFKIVLQADVRDNPNIVPSRFVLAIKHCDGRPDIYRARFVVDVHRDRDSGHMVRSATTLKQSSTCLLLALASIFEFDMYSIDVT